MLKNRIAIITIIFYLIKGPSRIKKYTKEILKNTKEKSGNRKFQFLALNTFVLAAFLRS